jgi:hypothetical protein
MEIGCVQMNLVSWLPYALPEILALLARSTFDGKNYVDVT